MLVTHTSSLSCSPGREKQYRRNKPGQFCQRQNHWRKRMGYEHQDHRSSSRQVLQVLALVKSKEWHHEERWHRRVDLEQDVNHDGIATPCCQVHGRAVKRHSSLWCLLQRPHSTQGECIQPKPRMRDYSVRPLRCSGSCTPRRARGGARSQCAELTPPGNKCANDE